METQNSIDTEKNGVDVEQAVSHYPTKKQLDEKLKDCAVEANFKIDGDFVTFDKTIKRDFELTDGLPLANLLTANPISFTKLSKTLLLKLICIQIDYGKPLQIRASYQSPEYSMLSFGAIDSKLYTTGCAVALGVPASDVSELYEICQKQAPGEVIAYPWGVHIGLTKENLMLADKRSETGLKSKFLNFLSNDKMKNLAIIAAAGAAAWFFIFRKK